MVDRALEQLETAVTATAGVAGIGKAQARPQRGAQDGVVIAALVFADSLDFDYRQESPLDRCTAQFSIITLSSSTTTW
jgi:hypothetical protein